MQKLIIDRFEGKYAVCEAENRIMLNIETSKLPEEANEGNCIIIDKDGNIRLDIEGNMARKERVAQMMRELFE